MSYSFNYAASGVDGVLTNEAQFMDVMMADLDDMESTFSGLEWEIFDDVPYSYAQDNKHHMVDTIFDGFTEAYTPLEMFVLGKISYSAMIEGMAAAVLDQWSVTQAISPRLSNMLAEGTDSPRFDYSKADPKYRDRDWVGWSAIGPGINTGA